MSKGFFSKITTVSTFIVNVLLIGTAIGVSWRYQDAFHYLSNIGLSDFDSKWILSLATILLIFLIIRLIVDINIVQIESRSKYIKVRFGIRWQYNDWAGDNYSKLTPRCKKHRTKLFRPESSNFFVCPDCGLTKEIHPIDKFKKIDIAIARARMHFYFDRA